MIWILLLPLALLLSGPGVVSAVLCAAVWFAVCLIFSVRKIQTKPLFEIRHPNLTLVTVLLSGLCFYLRWNDSPIFVSLEALPVFPAKRICGLTAALLGIIAVFGTDRLISLLPEWIAGSRETRPELLDTLTTGIFSAGLMTLVSECSPFYAFNDWVDPHTMFSVGKGILSGMVPYRDIFEQKGPLILFLHALAARISINDLTGLWILEIISCFCFLNFSRKIMGIRLGRKGLLWVPLTGLVVFTTLAFERGDSAEEFCLPLLSFALLTGLRIVSERRMPARRDWFLIGVTAAGVLWTKYSMLGFYFGWALALVLFFVKEKRIRDLRSGFGWGAAGLAAVSAPIMIWYACRGALSDLFRVYYYENIFLYPHTTDIYGRTAIGRNLLNGMLNFLVFCTPVFFAVLFGFFHLRKPEDRPVFRYVLYSFLGLFLVTYIPGRFYAYYSLIFGIFVPFGLLLLADWLRKLTNRVKISRFSLETMGTVSVLCCLAVVFLCCHNMQSQAFEREDFPQYQAGELIRTSGIEEPSLMNYRILDTGVNTAAGLTPRIKYFCDFNLPLDDIRAEQNTCLENGCVDFVITFMLEINSPNYELLADLPSLYPMGMLSSDYKLYQRIPR